GVGYAPGSKPRAGLAGRALALLQVLDQRRPRLLELLAYQFEDAGTPRLEFRARLAVDPRAGLAELLRAQGHRRALQGVNEVAQRIELFGRHRGLHLPQQRLAVLHEAVDQLRHEVPARSDQLELGEGRWIDDERRIPGVGRRRLHRARALGDQAGDRVQ